MNIGLDTVAFLDDNPVERQHVREQAPEAIVIHLPEDPMGYAQAVRDCPWFERLALSEEDLRRGEYYAAQRERVELERSVPPGRISTAPWNRWWRSRRSTRRPWHACRS